MATENRTKRTAGRASHERRLGGFMPGVDIAASSALQDAEDQEYHARMKTLDDGCKSTTATGS